MNINNEKKFATPSLSVVCVSAHPDDAEETCFGTLARYAEAGHRVTVLYLTRGQINIRGKSHDETAAIRSAEAEAACQIIGAKAVFADQMDGDTQVDAARTQAFCDLLHAQEPDVVLAHWPIDTKYYGKRKDSCSRVVLAHWPIDTHFDHQVASLLALRAYLKAPRPFRLFYFEVQTGVQTLEFTPRVYVDTASVLDKKRAAIACHASQKPEKFYAEHHELIERFRGREIGSRAAECFYPLSRDGGGLPELN